MKSFTIALIVYLTVSLSCDAAKITFGEYEYKYDEHIFDRYPLWDGRSALPLSLSRAIELAAAALKDTEFTPGKVVSVSLNRFPETDHGWVYYIFFEDMMKSPIYVFFTGDVSIPKKKAEQVR